MNDERERERPQIILRRAEVCERCGAADSMRQQEGMRDRGAFRQAYARCVRCGHKAQIRRLQG